MARQDDIEDQAANRHGGFHAGPYTGRHPVPTVQGYREHRAEIQERNQQTAPDKTEPVHAEDDESRGSKTKRAYESVKSIAKGEDQQKGAYGRDPYPATNRNWADRPQNAVDNQDDGDTGAQNDEKHKRSTRSEGEKNKPSATEQAASTSNPMDKRKAMKNRRSGAGREVTDPVTHLPIMVHDMTDQDLEAAPENMTTSESANGNPTGQSSTPGEKPKKDHEELQRSHRGMRRMFPPPDRGALKEEVWGVYEQAVVVASVAVGLGAVVLVGTIFMLPGGSIFTLLMLSGTAAVVVFTIMQVSGWLWNRVDTIFEDDTWETARQEETRINESEIELPESVGWLNSLLTSVWPLINPDLFISVADILEDVMQASLPKVIRMVSVDDLGQGSESIRILGLKLLPRGAAAESVDSNGGVVKGQEDGRSAPGEGQIEEAEDGAGVDGGDVDLANCMEAEEGDFVNLEMAFSYRARSSGKSITRKARNAHLYLKFYLPGGVVVPVWVELRGIVGIMRLRLQLTPDPPFFSLCTLTFLGQPRADISCVPLSKHSPNIMDVPLISKFVQSSIDAALSEYVAPKSLALDLKQMLVGDDFKKDTVSRGVILVYIKRAKGFKQGDGGIGPLKGSSDTYVTVSWGKLGKPVASTRIIVDGSEPVWNEWVSVLVTPEEMNAEETLRLQIWDSDKHTADDDLGRVELSLKELASASEFKNEMRDREDNLRGDDPDKKMPGTLCWSVGYYSKTRIQQDQLEKQTLDATIRTTEDLKNWASETAASKLRESKSAGDGDDERRQQTVQEFKEREDEMIISAPPPSGFPSGVLSIQIHNITGLEIARLNAHKERGEQDDEDNTVQDGDDQLADSYCSIFLNHVKVYKTRTKPKTANPFFNAGTERFVRDWRTAEVIISVRDRREHENDPLLGVVYLPLRRVFESRSQLMESFPIAGGIGYGRARISMVWRSFECKLPMELLGWEYGTLEVKGPIRLKAADDDKIKGCKIYLKTKIARGKMKSPSSDGSWSPKRQSQDGVFLAVAKRYRTPLMVEFRHKAITGDSTISFAVIWLSEIPDEEEKTLTLKVWKGDKDRVDRARYCPDYTGLEEGEKAIGEIEVTLKFWRGLGGYHKGYAKNTRNGHIRDAMEVLDTVNGEGLAIDEGDEGGSDTDSSTSDSDGSPSDAEKRKMLRKVGGDSSSSESDDEGDSKLPKRLKKGTSDLVGGNTNVEEEGDRGARAQLKEYKANHKQLHRKHRGVMQWKATRTLDWMAGKARRGKGKIGEVFEHGDKDGGIETEV